MSRIVTLLIGLFPLALSAQVLFTEDFESAPAFTLNTTDAGSSISAWNTWVVNNSYSGGSGDLICLGFPFTYTIVTTPGQPAGISTPNGNYLHTASIEGIADGITCCSFGAADGICIPADNTFSRMSSDVSTIGYPDVELSFWWLCQGATSIYGQVYYSTNLGANWIQITTPIVNYQNQGSWTEQTISNAAFGEQATLRFGFKFVNNTSLTALDPGFGIDDVTITAVTNQQNTITTSLPPPLGFCQGSGLSVPYAITGTFNGGNTFTAQLSDAAGSFAAPVTIGSVVSVTGGAISCTIPPGTPAGTGYRIRVVGSSPVTTGTDNGANISIIDAPYAGTDDAVEVCSSDAAFPMDLGGDIGGSWTGPSAVSNNMYDPGTMDPGVYTYTVTGTAPCTSDDATLTITESPGANAGNSAVAVICKDTGPYELFEFLGGNPQPGGTWTDPDGNPFSGTFDSDDGEEGIYTYTVPGAGGCPADDAVVTVDLGDPGIAGNDETWQVCSDQLPLDLYTQLSNANLTGIWFQNGLPFDGTIDEGGSYVYIDYAQAPCTNDTAFIEVIVNQAADAGSGGTVTVCSNDPSFALFDHLGGTPQPGGVWTDPLGAPHPGIFNPAVDASGLYTYTVSGTPPCADDATALAVIIDPCLGVQDLTTSGHLITWLGTEHGQQIFSTPLLVRATAEVLDVQGRCVMHLNNVNSTGRWLLDTRALAPGGYTLRISSVAGVGVVRWMR